MIIHNLNIIGITVFPEKTKSAKRNSTDEQAHQREVPTSIVVCLVGRSHYAADKQRLSTIIGLNLL